VDLWTCTQCASLNSRRSGKCYSCGSSRYPAAAGASGASRKRRTPLYLVIGGVAAVIVVLAGIGAMTLLGVPTQPPAIAALPSPSPAPATPTAPATTPAPTATPSQTQLPSRSGGPEGTALKPSQVMKSSNWAGYGLITGAFVGVSGEWTQPEIDCSAGRETNASFWVGLDGVTSHSVQQTGTSADCSAGIDAPEYFAWYEMYPVPMRKAPLEVHPGDHFRAKVHGLSAERFELTLENLTTGQTFTTSAGRFGEWPTSVEWIVEPAAMCRETCVTSELSRFDDVTFSNISFETTDGWVNLSSTDKIVEFDLRTEKGGQLADVSGLEADGTSFDIKWVGGTHRPAPSPRDR